MMARFPSRFLSRFPFRSRSKILSMISMCPGCVAVGCRGCVAVLGFSNDFNVSRLCRGSQKVCVCVSPIPPIRSPHPSGGCGSVIKGG